MGLLIKQKNIARETCANVYIRIDSVRAGMGEDGKITCSCGEWIETESRSSGESEFKANVSYHIPDENIVINGGTLIQAVYPALKKYFENMGYEVLDDYNAYETILEQEKEQEMLSQMQELQNGTNK